MTKTQPKRSIEYSTMTETEARQDLIADFGLHDVELWEDRNHIISYTDVLYYADAYGDLEDAILLQGWDKSLPETAHRGLLDSGLDIYEGVNCHNMETERCPSCGSDMWRFEIWCGDGHTQTEWVDEHGNVTDDWVEFVSEPDGYIWNAAPEDDHAPILCAACSMDSHYDFPRQADESGSVRVHFGETNEISGFSVAGNLVRFDHEWNIDAGMTDLWGLPGDYEGLPVALAENSLHEWLDEHDWTEIAQKEVKDTANPYISTRTFYREYRRIASEWADSDETHPDLDFTYVIDFATFGKPSFFVAEENKAALLAEIVDLIEMRYSR